MSSISADLPSPPKVQALQKRIGWLCHLGRLLAAAYAVWVLWLTGFVLAGWRHGQPPLCHDCRYSARRVDRRGKAGGFQPVLHHLAGRRRMLPDSVETFLVLPVGAHLYRRRCRTVAADGVARHWRGAD